MSSYVTCTDVGPVALGQDRKTDKSPFLPRCTDLMYFRITHLTNFIFIAAWQNPSAGTSLTLRHTLEMLANFSALGTSM